MRIAIVIPAFNEARTIRDVAAGAPARVAARRRRRRRLDGRHGRGADGACRCAWCVTRATSARPPRCGAASTCALAEGADCVATLDGDGQHDPADLRRLVRAAHAASVAIVIGARLLDRANAPASRRFANRIADFWISWAAGYPIADSQSGERVYPVAMLRVVEAAARPRRRRSRSRARSHPRRAAAASRASPVPIRATIYGSRAQATSVPCATSRASWSWSPRACSRAACIRRARGTACANGPIDGRCARVAVDRGRSERASVLT